MNSFSFKRCHHFKNGSVLLSYPIPIFFTTRMTTPKFSKNFPMEISEYSVLKLPTKPLNILTNFSCSKSGCFRRDGEYDLPFKIASLYHLEKPKVSFYFGRVFAQKVCLIYFLRRNNI